MTIDHDLLTTLQHARPTDADLDAAWPAAQRTALLDRILESEAPQVRRAGLRRPALRRTAYGVAAAGLAGAAFVPTLFDSGSAAAADLHVLAGAAIHAGPAVPEPGQWQHTTTTSVQHNVPGYDGPNATTYRDTVDTWTDYEGRSYVADQSLTRARTEYAELDPAPPSYADPTPAFSATLPDHADGPDGLLAYLDSRVTGSTTHAEAMYSALIELAGSHTLPPRTLAAAFDALATIDHVTTTDVTAAGRPAIEVSYDEASTDSGQSDVFDRATGAVLSEHQYGERSDYRSTTVVDEVVDEVPPSVVARSRRG